jgi:hypothetical protein
MMLYEKNVRSKIDADTVTPTCRPSPGRVGAKYLQIADNQRCTAAIESRRIKIIKVYTVERIKTVENSRSYAIGLVHTLRMSHAFLSPILKARFHQVV